MDLNRSTLLWRLTQDLELKVTPAGKKVLTTSIVTNDTYIDSAGNKQETADFHNLVLWGKLAENLSNYARKWSRIYIEGALKTRSWEDTDWSKRYKTEVLVSNFILLDFKKDNETNPSHNYNQTAKTKPVEVKQEERISIEDIPF